MIKSKTMTESNEHYVKADAILTADGFVRNKALHIKSGIIAGLPDNHLLDDTARILEYPGHVVTPCFCDYHMHFLNNNPAYINAIAEDLNSSGIKAVFEGGDKNFTGMHVKENLKSRLSVKTAGCAIYKKGTYGRYIGKGVEGVKEARKLINQLQEEGVDYIKIINSGIFVPDTGDITPGGFVKNELNEIIRHALDRGLTVACHANGERAIHEAVAAGSSYIIHGLYVSGDTLSAMAENGSAFVPTINAFACLKTNASNKEAVQHIERAVDCHLSAINRAAEHRVILLPGSDSGPDFIPYGRSYLQELQWFHRAGIYVDEILKSAAAEHLGIGTKADYAVMNKLEIIKVVTN